MKVLLVVGDAQHPAPSIAPSSARLARDLVELGHDAITLLARHDAAGETRIERSVSGAERAESAPRSATLVRTDPAPGHWQRARSSAVAARVREYVRAEAPDLVHVLAWRGATLDLVATCAQIGVPAVATVADAWLGCLVGDRVQRADGSDCAQPLGPMPCLACAEIQFGATPWVPIEARFLGVAERRRDALRELQLARRVLIADARAADRLRAALSDPLADVEFALVADASDAQQHARHYAEVLAGSKSPPAAKATEWWEERMQNEAERAWDDAFTREVSR